MSSFPRDDNYVPAVGGKSTVTNNAIPVHALPVGAVNALTIAVVDASGNQITSFGGTTESVDAGNSSTSTLTSGSTFTGTGKSTLGFTSIEVLVYSDQSSATGGVQIQFSSNNTNYDDASTFTFTAGNAAPNAGQVYIIPVRAQYYRVVYINGGTGQTAFRLSSILKAGHPTGETIPMSDVPTALGSHGLLTKSAIVGKTTAGGGSFVDVKVNPSGALTAAVTAADGDVFVRSNAAATFPVTAVQGTAANLNATVVGTGTFAVQATLAAETTKVIGTVNQGTSPWVVAGGGTAGTAATGVVTVQGIAGMTALDVNIKSETAPAVTLTRVAIAASSSGDNTLIAAVSAKKIYVVAFELSFSGTVNAKFTDGAAGTNLGGLYYGVANAGAANSISPDMKLATPSPYLWAGSTNTALVLNLSGATAVGGAITYFTV
ncbi:MAG TPA: hypothetical protein VF941_11775 [Clostridia bacterium]